MKKTVVSLALASVLLTACGGGEDLDAGQAGAEPGASASVGAGDSPAAPDASEAPEVSGAETPREAVLAVYNDPTEMGEKRADHLAKLKPYLTDGLFQTLSDPAKNGLEGEFSSVTEDLKFISEKKQGSGATIVVSYTQILDFGGGQAQVIKMKEQIGLANVDGWQLDTINTLSMS